MLLGKQSRQAYIFITLGDFISAGIQYVQTTGKYHGNFIYITK